jgi:hypothetical protein
MERPATYEEWWALRPPLPSIDERQLDRLYEMLARPIPAAHDALKAFTDVMAEGFGHRNQAASEEERSAWGLGFETALGIAMQEPEAVRQFYQEYQQEVCSEHRISLADLLAEDRADADYFLDIWQAKKGAQ